MPGVARDYTTQLIADVTTTTPDATLSYVENSTTAAGHLVNGTRALQQPLKIRAATAANPNPAYTALSETGASTNLLTWTEPVTASRVTLGFQQSIGASETLLRGTYGKTVTFTLSSTTP